MEFLSKHKKIFITGMTLLCLIMIALTANNRLNLSFLQNTLGFVITPVQSALSSVGQWARERVEFLTRMNELQAEVKRLQEENAVLQAENLRLELKDRENETLSELLDIKRQYEAYPTTGAKIIAKDPTEWYDAYTINKGTKDGLKVNLAALAPGGLMGLIVECHYDYSIVVSVIDDRSVIAAKSVRSENLGFVKGDSTLMREGLCQMEIIDIHAQIAQGDEIVTSPMSSYYPAGILIGVVKDIIPDPNGLTKHAVIQPAVSLNNLENVLIVTDRSATEDAPSNEPERG
ncbi:MAG: rod shape-determining protein MreC [Clostridiales bacterium]|nr:rod shape-determining protein MreC [Clostridiales bacterium]